MVRTQTKSNESDDTDSALNMAAIMFLVAVFAPYGILISGGGNSITSIVWNLDWGTWGHSLTILQPWQWIASLPLTFLRFIFTFEMYRLYLGKSTITRALWIGILDEIPITIFGIIGFIPVLFNPLYLYTLIALPIPGLLLVGWLIIRFRPPPIEYNIRTSE